MIMNLINETIEILAKNGKQTKDVLWVGAVGYASFSWEHFVMIADINYNSGFGGQEIAEDLVVCGDNWWLERHEYDGSEWWEFKSLPIKPPEKEVLRVRGEGLWINLESINS